MKRQVGDTVPLNGITYIDAAGTPLDWTSTGYTPKLIIETASGTVTLAATSITAHPTQTFTAEADDDFLTCNDHGVKEGDQIVVANSGGALPTGLSASTRYWATNVSPNRFQVEAAPGAGKINLTTDGTGTNTFYVVGSWQATNAQASLSSLTAQPYRAWVAAYNGATLVETAPVGASGFAIDVQAQGN
jgi:hypothetical protein